MKGLVATIAILTSTTAVQALDWPYIIDIAGRQRMLTQRMSKEFLLVAAGYKPEDYRKKLLGSIKLFDDTLAFLKKETASVAARIDRDIQAIYAKWIPFKEFLENNADSVQHTDVGVLLEVTSRNLPLLVVSNTLVTTYGSESGVASNLAINLAGKQRMRIQRMMKGIVAVSLGVDVKAHLNDLKTMSFEFTESHTGIIRGLVLVGVPELDNMCTMKQMRLVSHSWQLVEPIIMEIVDEKTHAQSTNTAKNQLDSAISDGEVFFKHMVDAVKLFVNPKSDCDFLYDLTRDEIVFLINTGAKQLMLGQKATFLYLLTALNVDKSKSMTDLLLTSQEGETTMRQLIEGDVSNKIPSPPSQAFLDGLQDALKIYLDLKTVFDAALYQQKTDKHYVSKADANSQLVLEKMSGACELMVQDAENWTHAKGVSFSARQLDMSGRQRMLMHKMSKEAAFIKYGMDVDANKDLFEATVAQFKDSHMKLLNGVGETNASDGIPPTTDHCIIQQLKKVMDIFTQLEETARAVAYGADDTDSVENLRRLESLSEEGFGAMDRAVGFYIDGQGTCDSPANSDQTSVHEEWVGYLSLSSEEWESYVMKLGRLRELIHIVSKNYWLVQSGLNRTHYKNAFDASIEEVYDSIQILKFGADTIHAPRSKADYDLIVAIEKEWSIFEQKVKDRKTADAIYPSDEQMLAEVERLIDRAASAADAVGTKVPVLRLNLVGRQLALVEQMTKEVVTKVWGVLVTENRRLSTEGGMPWVSTMRLYETSHQELLQMTHDQRDDVFAQMKRTQDAWVVYKEALLVVADGTNTLKDLRTMDSGLAALRAELQSTFQAYAQVVEYVPTIEPTVRYWVRLVQVLVPAGLVLFPAVTGACQGARSKKSSMEP